MAAYLVVASAFVASSVSGHVIDNFEQGTFDVLAPAGASGSGSQAALLPFNCIADTREVIVTSNSASQPAGAGLSLSPQDDEMATVMPDGGGSVVLNYDIGAAVDLTVGGTRDRIRVTLSVSPDGGADDVGEIRLSLEDHAGFENAVSLPFTTAGNVDFWFSDYTGIDIGNIRRVDVVLVAYDVGDYHVRDIRTVKIGTPLVYNPVEPFAVAGPSYPTEPMLWEGITDPEGAMAPAGNLSLLIADAQVDPSLPCESYCDGVPYGLFTMPSEIYGHSEAWLTYEGNDLFPAEQMIGFELELMPPADHTYGAPMMSSMWVNGGFMVEVSMELFDEAGASLGMTEHVITGDLMNDLSPVLSDFMPSFVNGNNLHIGIAIRETMPRVPGSGSTAPRVSSIEPGDPVLGIRVESTAGEPVIVSVPGGGTVRQQLAARPTVMRTQTTLDLGELADVARGIDIYDVSGRRVRALHVPSGSRLARWDGRTASGRRVGPGVYIARVSGVRGNASTRLVVIR